MIRKIKNNYYINMQVFFVAESINNMCKKFDINDNGTKVFGYFKNFSYETQKRVNKIYIKKLIKLFEDIYKNMMVFIIVNSNIKFYDNNKYLSYSDGKKFVTKQELLKKFKEI